MRVGEECRVEKVIDDAKADLFVFFQAEDGIRDIGVTGVQTCALPICPAASDRRRWTGMAPSGRERGPLCQIGRASCRGKSVDFGGRRIIKKKNSFFVTVIDLSFPSESSPCFPASIPTTSFTLTFLISS